MILTHIAACSKNRVIGTQGDLPWSIPEDMKFFRETTKGHIMIMGRKTYDSLPGPLPNRYHIVISRNPSQQIPSTTKSPVIFVTSLTQAIEQAKTLTSQWGEEVFIVGGGEIYKQSLDVTDKIYLTLIHREFQGDTYYPEIDEKVFKLTARQDVNGEIPFSFLTYVKK